MHELTLRWLEAGEVRTQTIWDQQPSKNPGRVRLGRDPTRCDIVLLHPTVSGLHVEIFYHRKRNYFYLRNLRHTNPPKVDGTRLYEGEVMLREGSIIFLGQVKVKVIAIDPIVSASLLLSQTLAGDGKSLSPVPEGGLAVGEKRERRRFSYGDAGRVSRLLPAYGLECHQCQKISPPKLLEFGCPWCGASLTQAKRVAMH